MVLHEICLDNLESKVIMENYYFFSCINLLNYEFISLKSNRHTSDTLFLLMLLTSHYGGVFGLTSLSNIVEKFDANKYD